MTIDYKKELEKAAKSMILVHDPEVLIKMIARVMIQKVKVKHAGILLYDREKNTYILTVSRGPLGIKIPTGFCRMDPDNPLITFFREEGYQKIFKGAMLTKDMIIDTLNKNLFPIKKEFLEEVLSQMELFEVVACVPSYFQNDLLGILLLGCKTDGRGFSSEESDFFMALASDVAMAIRNAQLFKQLQIELEKEKQLFLNTTLALAAAIDAKDHYTRGHTQRVTELSLKIAQKIKEIDKGIINENFLENLKIAALLHDIGKIGVPENILTKKAYSLKRKEKR
ncbi:MAG: HD domain-containing protein [Candidatus Omnitrophica bacterium]|nr:HD domain-containing protein [Candidatus Omnitrophota bacterium]